MDQEWINSSAKCREESRVYGRHGSVDPPERLPWQRILMDKPPLFTLARNNCIVFLTMTERACVQLRPRGWTGFVSWWNIEGFLPHDDVKPSPSHCYAQYRKEFRRRQEYGHRINCHYICIMRNSWLNLELDEIEGINLKLIYNEQCKRKLKNCTK